MGGSSRNRALEALGRGRRLKEMHSRGKFGGGPVALFIFENWRASARVLEHKSDRSDRVYYKTQIKRGMKKYVGNSHR